jgi:hypothetical protein
MKKVFILLFMIQTSTLFAQCLVFEGSFGSKVIARIENNMIYEGRYSHEVLARIHSNFVLEGRSSYNVLAHTNGNVTYKGRHGNSSFAYVMNNVIYEGSGVGAKAVARTQSCSEIESSSAAVILLLAK